MTLGNGIKANVAPKPNAIALYLDFATGDDAPDDKIE
jgi:hypothetical protein